MLYYVKKHLNIKHCNIGKLVPNLKNKTNCVVHFKNFQIYLKLGMKWLGVKRVISFKQSNWMEPYIMFNTNCRTNATSSFEKDLYKLLNNAVFGKTMENVREYVDVELVSDPARFKKTSFKTKIC